MKVDLAVLIEWFHVNKLSLNIGKTNFVVFQNKSNKCVANNESDINELLKFGSECISQAPQVKFLVLHIDENLTWSQHSKNVLTKLSKSTYYLNSVKNILPRKCMKQLYNSFVSCYLIYGINIWGPSISKANLNLLVKSQKKIIRIVKNTRYNAHTDVIFKELGILKLSDIIDVELSKFMFKFNNNELPVALNNLFQLNSEIHHYGTRNRNDPRVPCHKSAKFNNSFLARGPSVWADLPYDIKNDSYSKNMFISKVKKLKFDSY